MFESILEPTREKWLALSKRDQNALMVLSIALSFSVVIFGVIFPVINNQAKLQSEFDNAQSVYTELLSLAPSALASNGTTQNFDASSINTEVRRQAARYGLEIQRFEPDGALFKVWLEDARYPSVVQWLGGLETIGISHREITMEDRPKPGFVSVRVTFGVGE